MTDLRKLAEAAKAQDDYGSDEWFDLLEALSPDAILTLLDERDAATDTIARIRAADPLNIPLDVFLAPLTTRTRNVIKAEIGAFTESVIGYLPPPYTVRHLMLSSRKEIKRWPNFGKKSINELEHALRDIGLQLWEWHDAKTMAVLKEIV